VRELLAKKFSQQEQKTFLNSYMFKPENFLLTFEIGLGFTSILNLNLDLNLVFLVFNHIIPQTALYRSTPFLEWSKNPQQVPSIHIHMGAIHSLLLPIPLPMNFG
jgi:hypothetical protein